MTIENTYIVDRNLKTIVDQLEDVKELLSSDGGGSGDGCDCEPGYEVINTQLFSETVTTVIDPEYPDEPAFGELSYSTQLTADTIVVTFDGTDYTCQRIDGEPGSYVYGGWSVDSIDFSTIPFCIFSEDGYNSIATETEGTYALSASGSIIVVSSSFQNAVNQCVDVSMMPMLCVSGVTTLDEIIAAGNRLLYFQLTNPLRTKLITMYSNDSFSFIPSDANITASIIDGVFIVSAI